MPRSPQQLRDDALAIWNAGLEAVRSDRLVRENVRVEGDALHLGEEQIALSSIRRIAVVGGGKAGAGMAAGLEEALGERLLRDKQVAGLVSVPENSVRRLQCIELAGGRPAGKNEPTEQGVEIAGRILDIVGSLTDDDLCICLLSGGGSALLPAPAEGVSLADKQALTKHLSGAGAEIGELNTVRKQLSRLKGGRLAGACRAGQMIVLIISDVLGDPLDTIASGPTTPDRSTAHQALEVLEKFGALDESIAPSAVEYLKKQDAQGERQPEEPRCRVTNLIIGNNATAVDAAGVEAERRGYSHAMTSARRSEGLADDVGRHLADMAYRMRREEGPDCLITGGEPVVELADAENPGKGGRSQQLVLAALQRLLDEHADDENPFEGIALLSGGTDGEDGPTDAAGALADAAVFSQMREQGLAPADYLRRNDAYHFFQPLDALLKTGPTDTNVCDVRVVVVDRVQGESELD